MGGSGTARSRGRVAARTAPFCIRRTLARASNSDQRRQPGQALGGGDQGFVALGEAEARQERGAGRVLIEGGGGHGGDADLAGQPAAEGGVVGEAEPGKV